MQSILPVSCNQLKRRGMALILAGEVRILFAFIIKYNYLRAHNLAQNP